MDKLNVFFYYADNLKVSTIVHRPSIISLNMIVSINFVF